MKVTEKEIEVMDEKEAKLSMYLSDFPHDEKSVKYGYLKGFKQAQSMNEPQSREKEHLMWQTLHTLRLQVPNEISDVVFNSVVECFKEKGILDLDPDLPSHPQT